MTKRNMATLDELLQTTSRTFALAIPLLPAAERVDVTLGYLVFRIADTLEDADNLTCSDRIEALSDLSEALASLVESDIQGFTQRWAPRRPCDNDHYQQLMEQTPDVLLALASRTPHARNAVVRHAQRSIAGMQETLRRADASGTLCCDSIDQLRGYCYFVAGIVGELLTDLFEPTLDDQTAIDALRADARWFGEGLQLVNILKDAEADRAAGRTYLPATASLDEVFAIAADDLARAGRYIDSLKQAKAPAGYVAFCQAPRELAVATLKRLRVDGPGAKISRPEVAKILQRIHCETLSQATSSADSVSLLHEEA